MESLAKDRIGQKVGTKERIKFGKNFEKLIEEFE